MNCEPYSIIVGASVICAEQPQHIHHIFPFISELSVKNILVQLYFPESLRSNAKSDKLTEGSPFCGRAMKPSPLMRSGAGDREKNWFVEFDRLDSPLRGGHKLGS